MTQPLIDLTQLGTDITDLLTPPIGGAPNGYVLTLVSGSPTWAASTASSLASLSDVVLTAPTTGQVLTYNGTDWVNQSPVAGGTVTSISAISSSSGLGVAGSPITTSGTLTFSLGTELQNLSLITTDGFIQRTGGVYQGAALTSSQVTTALGFTPYSATNPAGYITGNQTITLSGDVTGSGATAIVATLAASGVTAGTYNNVTVNTKGLVTGGSNAAYITSLPAFTASGDATGTFVPGSPGNLPLTLAASGVTAGAYAGAWNATTVTIPTFTVDGKGRLTVAGTANYTRTLFGNSVQGEVPASGGGTTNFLRADGTWSVPATNPGTVTSVAATTSSTGLAITGSPITSNGTLTFTLNAELQGLAGLGSIGFVQRTGAGAYTAAAITSSQITTALGFTPLNATTPLNTVSPLVGGNAALNSPLTLSILKFNGTNPGYVPTNATVTMTQFLRDDGTWATPVGSVTSVNASGGTTGLTFTGGPITSSGTLTLSGTLAIANGGTGQTTASGAINALLPSQTGQAGNFLTTNGTVASWASGGATGVTSFNTRTGAVTLTSSDVTTALGYTPLQYDAVISLSGDATGSSPGSGNNTVPVTLATVNSNVGSFGSASQSATITVNAKGLVTAASNTTITPAAIGAATTTGSNASGTWPINITGNAATASNGGVTSVTGTSSQITSSPTTGAVVLSLSSNLVVPTPATGVALTVNGANGSNAAIINGGSTSGSSYGLLLTAGTTSADRALLVRNVSGTPYALIAGDGSGYLGYNGSANTIAFNAGGAVTVAAPTSGTALTLNSTSASTGAINLASGLLLLAGSAGTAGQVLTSGGPSAAPTWTTAASGGVTSITGTTNQVIASASTGAITLSLPQSIATTSTPTFSTLTLGASSATIGAAPTYGATTISGSAGGWAGLAFSGASGGMTLMMSAGSNLSGVYCTSAPVGGSAGWQWYFTGSVLTTGTVPAANIGAGTAAISISGNAASASIASTVTTTGTGVNANIDLALANGTSIQYSGNFTANPATGQLNAVLFNTTSDRHVKTEIRPIENAVNLVNQINGVKFRWKDNGNKSVGLIAQEVEEILPELVDTNQSNRKSLNYNGIVGVLVEAVKEMSATINALKAEIELLKVK